MPKPKRISPAQQSDIVIRPDGEVVISFLWDDLGELAGREVESSPAAATLDGSPIANVGAEFFSAEYSSCKLCPKKCGVNRNLRAHPTCGDSLLRVSNSGISHGDEPSIRGTRGSGMIMLSGCPLRCPSCHNPEKVAEGEPVTIAEFVELMRSIEKRGAHNVQILSPTVHLPALRAALQAVKSSGFTLPIIFKSSGYESVEELKKLAGLVDVYLPDFKFGSCSTWADKAGVRSYFETSKEAIAEMIRQAGPLVLDGSGAARKGVLVRHVLSPLPPAEREMIMDYLKSLPVGVGVSILDTFQNLDEFSWAEAKRRGANAGA